MTIETSQYILEAIKTRDPQEIHKAVRKDLASKLTERIAEKRKEVAKTLFRKQDADA